MQDFLQPSLCVDSDHPEVLALARKLADPHDSELENAITLYYWVRDEIRYNPYSVSGEIHNYRASATLEAKQGWCVPKAILLAALCRAANIPARLGFADVRNHLSTEQMREMMQLLSQQDAEDRDGTRWIAEVEAETNQQS